ncbi:MAG TPA: hypothetical protein VD886_05965 [Herpetosiphonaceae bacterium]|nr:hypothetical protein [Herpetosiphonaceae bacterium]
MIRRIASLSVLFVLLLSVFVAPQRAARAATTAAPTPTLIAEVNGSGKGRVWVGAVPANSSTKPVLVFVHGLHGKAPGWWGATEYYGTNDMYDRAYGSGYRTAFVSLDDEVDGPASSVWANGATLNRQLDVILAYYGVSSVNIVAHSKGGVDTNSALVHYGASPKIQKIVTLSSPHRGSQLADLAYSWWAGWLASLLGQKDDGTYTMQTGYMSYFRSVTDGRPEYNNVRFYTSGGTHHGPWFSAMWFGGGYLPGDNDGVVTVSSSHHPQQYSRLFTSGSLNHDNIRKGSDVWSLIEPTLRTGFRSGATTASDTTGKANKTPVEATAQQPSAMILRGGELANGAGSASLPVEGGVRAVTFDLLASRNDVAVTFVAPDGARYAASAPVADAEGVFRGAFHYTAQVQQPRSGAWSVEMKGAAGTGYMLVASLDSGLTVALDRPNAQAAASSQIQFSVQARSANGADAEVKLDAALSGTPVGREKASDLPTQLKASANGKGRASAALTAPAATGLYQVGLTVTGVAADGTAFERSFATNLPVISQAKGKQPALDLPAGR